MAVQLMMVRLDEAPTHSQVSLRHAQGHLSIPQVYPAITTICLLPTCAFVSLTLLVYILLL